MISGEIFRLKETIGFSYDEGPAAIRRTLLARRGSILVSLDSVRPSTSRKHGVLSLRRSVFIFEDKVVYRHDSIEDMLEDLKWIEIV